MGALTSSTWRSTAAQPSPSATHMSVSHAMTSQVHGGLRQRTRRVWERPHLLTRYLCCLWRLCHPRGTAQAARRCCRQGGRVEEGQVRRWAPRSGIETTVRGGRTGTSRRWSLDIFRSGAGSLFLLGEHGRHSPHPQGQDLGSVAFSLCKPRGSPVGGPVLETILQVVVRCGGHLAGDGTQAAWLGRLAAPQPRSFQPSLPMSQSSLSATVWTPLMSI